MAFFKRKPKPTHAAAPAAPAAPAVVDVPATSGIAGDYTIDASHTRIGFVARHAMVTSVQGSFKDFAGTAHLDDANPAASSVTLTIQTGSVDTGSADRDGHLVSADFFDVENHPTATFVSTSVRPDGDDYVLGGDFTLKGVTKPIDLKLEFNGVNPGMGHGEVAGFTATVVLNRKDFGVDVDMPLETGGTVIGDKVTITLEIEALKQA